MSQSTESIITTDPKDVTEPVRSEATRQQKYRRALMEQQKDRDEDIEQFFLKRRDDLRKIDLDARRKHMQDIDQMCRYYNGHQYGDYDESGVYQPYTLQDGDFAYTIPVINGHVDQAFMQLMKTRIEYQFSPTNRTDPNAQQVTKMCEELAVAEKDRLMTEDAQTEEIYNSLLAGESHRCLLWAVNPDSPKTVKRVKQIPKIIILPGSRSCEACKSEVGPEDKVCPKCGASFIKEIPPGRTTQYKAVPEEVVLSENVLHIPHLMSVQRSLAALRFKDSSFIVERDYLPKHKAQWDYQIEIKAGTEGLTEEVRMRQELERSSGQLDAVIGSSRQNALSTMTPTLDSIQREQIYLDVSEYGWRYNQKEVTLPDGTPEGFKLKVGFIGDQCPNGIYLMFLGDTLARFKPRHRNRVWSIVLYGKRPGSSRGAGLQLLIPLQDIVNDTFNLDYSILMTVGQPLTVVSRQAVKELPEAGQFLFVDKLPQNMNGVDKAVTRIPGASGSGMIGATADRIAAAMQFIAGTYTIGAGGAPDMQNASKTATEVAARVEQASGRMIGPIKQRIAADKEFMFQILENIKEFSAPEQKRELVKRFGPDTCQAFFECNFRQSFKITIAENTDMPRSMALTQANTMAFAQVAQGLATAEVPWAAELLATIADVLGIPFNVGQGRNDRREAEYRLNKLRAIEDRVKMKNPETLTDPDRGGRLLFAKLEEFCGPQSLQGIEDEDGRAAYIFMQDHAGFMDVYKDFLFGEEAKTATDSLKLAVIQLWTEHKKASLIMEEQTATWTAEIQATLNPAPEEPDPETLAAAQAEEDKRQLTALAVQHEAEQEGKDADLERQEAAKDADLERETVKAEHGAATQIAVEQAKAAMQPKAEAPAGRR